jgi:hypothetical protein
MASEKSKLTVLTIQLAIGIVALVIFLLIGWALLG